ncbi:type IV secretory system conjugative DNA transfer family protein [Oceaniradius stylonematis]|uniref:type IV secretory system conjugative DNA transfer family protein n=1 Tax=Oceaniradius stylonematis TaxID=2184161 RepID=UPI00273E0A52|nr:type IV secretory system conjugative DNA transfer family protein [Oceaniradius stylonematis]
MNDALQALQSMFREYAPQPPKRPKVEILPSELEPLAWDVSTQPKRLGTALFESEAILTKGPIGPKTFVIACCEGTKDVYGVEDDRHVAIIGSPRSGKTAGSLMMNAIMHQGSLVALDIKGELATVSARARSKGSIYTRGRNQKTVILDPFHVAGRDDDPLDDLRGGFNPLDFIDPDDREGIDEAFQLADALCPQEATGKSEPFFPLSARSIVALTILHVRTSPDIRDEDRNLVTVQKLIAGGDHEQAEFWRELEPEHAPNPYSLLFDAMRKNKAFDGLIARTAERFGAARAEAARQFHGVLEVANLNLQFLQSAGMQELFSRSTCDLDDLKGDKNGISIYLCLPPRYLDTYFGFFRAIITMIIRQLERDIRSPANGSPVLMLLDEFPALKRMPVVENAMAQIAGYGVRMVIAAQTLAQLKSIYRDNWETFMGSVGLKLFFGNEDNFTRDYISKLIGETEIGVVTHGYGEGTNTSTTVGENWSDAETDSLNESTTYTETKSGGVTHGPGLNGSTNEGWSYSTAHQFGKGKSHTATKGGSRSDSAGSSRSSNRQTTPQLRPLLRMDEVGRIASRIDDPEDPNYPGLLLALLSGQNPVLLKRSLYFQERLYEGWYDPHPAYRYPPTLALRLDHKISSISAMLQWVESSSRDKIHALEAENRQSLHRARQEVQAAHAQALEAQRRALKEDEERRRKEAQRQWLEALGRWMLWAPVIVALGMLVLSFTGYFGMRLLRADTFTMDALWRAIKAFPLTSPDRWGGYLLPSMGVFGVIGMLVGSMWLNAQKERLNWKWTPPWERKESDYDLFQ